MPQAIDVLKDIVSKELTVSSRIKEELELLDEAPTFIVEGFLKAYQAVHVMNQKPQMVNECDSQIAFDLGITSKQPTSSFHYPVQPSALPDIDSDFADNHRVMAYATQKYGADNVCKIGTRGNFKFKSLLKSLTTLFTDENGERLISLKEINEFTKKLGLKVDTEIKEEDEESDDEGIETDNEHIQAFQRQYPYVFEHFRQLLGLPRYNGVHAAGILILPQAFRNTFPIMKIRDKEEYATEFTEGQGVAELGKMGGIKIDLLGLMTLGILEIANSLVVSRYGLTEESPSPCICKEQGIVCDTNYKLPMMTRYSAMLGHDVTLIDLDRLCLKIEPAYQTIRDGKTEGIFQFEPRGITDFAKSYEPREFADLYYITSLYRPGAMDCHLDADGMPIDKETSPEAYYKAKGAHVRFVERRHGRDKVAMPAKRLEPILGPSFGIAVFQENISQIAMEMTGCSFAEAEVIRKFFTKVKPELLRTDPDTIAKVKKMEDKFVADSEANGCTKSEALAAWSTILPFARYGFAKAHAVAYSLISYQTAVFRALYPLEFLIGLLTLNEKEEKILSYIRAAQKLGISVKKPDINVSETNFSIDSDNAIRAGLNLIKGVGSKAADIIVENRKIQGPFKSVEDFLERPLVWRIVNAKILDTLSKAGAFDSITDNRHFANAKMMVAKNKAKKSDFETIDIFDEDGKRGRKNLEIVVEDWTSQEKLDFEREMFGFPFEDAMLKNAAEVEKYYRIFENVTQNRGKQAAFGILDDIYVKPDKNGNNMAFITAKDFDGNKQRWIMFSSIYGSFGKKLKKNEPFFSFGKTDNKGESFIIEGIETINNFIDMFNKFKSKNVATDDE